MSKEDPFDEAHAVINAALMQKKPVPVVPIEGKPARRIPNVLGNAKLPGPSPQIDAIARAVVAAAAARTTDMASITPAGDEGRANAASSTRESARAADAAFRAHTAAEEEYEPTARFDVATLKKQHRALEANAQPYRAAHPGGHTVRDGRSRWTAVWPVLLGLIVIGSFVVGYRWMSSGRSSIPSTGESVPLKSQLHAVPNALATPLAPPTSSRESMRSSLPVRTAKSLIKVRVIGAVNRPGVHYLLPTEHISDAIMAAGDAKRNADLKAIDLAAPVKDGQQIFLPMRRRPTRVKRPAAPAATRSAQARSAARRHTHHIYQTHHITQAPIKP